MAAINERMTSALNDQINAEFYSAYLYLSMAAHFASRYLQGFANWMKIQTQEELFHATKLYEYVSERGGRVQLKIIDAPPAEWKSTLAVFQAGYDHELMVSRRISDLVDLAREVGDHATESFLLWYVSEQVEEEASANAAVQQLRLAGDAPGALFMLDREFGQRTFTPPAAKGA